MFDMLHGLRVLDLGTGVSGPYCAKLLLDAGASVVRVEPPGGDPLRSVGPPVEDGAGAAFAFCNAGKQSVVLDYAQPDGARRLWELLRWADIVIENEAPGVLARHGFGPGDVLAARPAMVYVSITGYGQTGPRRDWRITELTIGAAGGMVDLNGADDREPLAYPGHVMAIWSGAAAAAGALAAWRHARRTGIGQHVDVSMQEAIASTLFLYYADYEYTGAIQPRGQRELLEASRRRSLPALGGLAGLGRVRHRHGHAGTRHPARVGSAQRPSPPLRRDHAPARRDREDEARASTGGTWPWSTAS